MKETWSTLILAAGKGTRMKSDLAKVLHPIDGKPLLTHVLDTAARLQMEKTIVVVGHQADAVKDAHAGYDLAYALQDPQLGTGHAVMCAREHLEGLSGNLLVLYGDVPLLRPATLHELMERHELGNNGVTVLTARLEDPTGYGRVFRDENGGFLRIVEHKDLVPDELGNDEINSGIYTFRIEALLEALSQLKNDNAQGEYYLTDTLEMIRESGLPAGIMEISDPEEISGINTPDQLADAAAVRANRIAAGEGRWGTPVLDVLEAHGDELILTKRDGMIVALSPHPYNAGHLWITPEEPTVFFETLSSEARERLFALGREAEGWLEEAYQPQGFNLGFDSGGKGQLVMHVVPRWTGDSNFMPVIAGVNVLPEDLPATREKLLGILGDH